MTDTADRAAVGSTMVCFHPYQGRVLADWVESCGSCRECRWSWETGYWPPARRRIVCEGGRVRYFDREGRLFRNVAVR